MHRRDCCFIFGNNCWPEGCGRRKHPLESCDIESRRLFYSAGKHCRFPNAAKEPAGRLMPHSFRNWRPKGPTVARPGRKAGIGLQRDRAPRVRYHKRCKCRTFGARRGDHSLPRPHGRGYFLAALRALMNWNMDDIAAKTMQH